MVIGHGVTLNRTSVARLGSRLAERGHRVLVWELPGHGEAAPADESWSVESLGAALAEAIRLQRFDELPVVVGVSLGGYASLEAVGGPSALGARGLVLIGCGSGPVPPPDPERLLEITRWASGTPLSRATASTMAVAELGEDDHELEALVERWTNDAQAGHRFLPAYLALYTRRDAARPAAVVAERAVPAVVVRGAQDPWVPHDAALGLAAALGTVMTEVAAASHQPQHTRPWVVAQSLRPVLE